MIFQIDLTAVTNAIGYKNVASVGNKYRALKKRFDFKLGSKNGSGHIATLKAADTGSVNLPVAEAPEPVTPKPVKKRAAPSPLKGNGRRKGAKAGEGPVPAGTLSNPDATGTQPTKTPGQRGRRKVNHEKPAETDAPRKQAKMTSTGDEITETLVANIGEESFYIKSGGIDERAKSMMEAGGDTEIEI